MKFSISFEKPVMKLNVISSAKPIIPAQINIVKIFIY